MNRKFVQITVLIIVFMVIGGLVLMSLAPFLSSPVPSSSSNNNQTGQSSGSAPHNK